jgi:excisionase family DNA binding protein
MNEIGRIFDTPGGGWVECITSKYYRKILHGINAHAVIFDPERPKARDCVRLLTVIVFLCTFDVVKLGRGKQFTSRRVENRPILGNAAANSPRENNVPEPKYALPRVMTVRELSTYLRVHPSTIYKLLRRGELPGFRIGTDWRFNAEVIDRWCLERNMKPAEEPQSS